MKITYKSIDSSGNVISTPKFSILDKVIYRNSDSSSIYTMYYGSDEELLELTDYNEYDWKFLISKLTYNSKFPLDNLYNKTKVDIVGTNYSDIEKVYKTFFPTAYSYPSETNTLGYFGSITIGKQKLYMFSISPLYTIIDIYDTTLYE